MQPVKNIIFDLGGVILNIDFRKTEEAFRKLGLDDFAKHISPFHITGLFEQYEVGTIDDDAFIAGIGKLMQQPSEAAHIIAAWNALLLDFPPERIALLQRIKTKYRTFLLSNTNALHEREFQQRLYDLYGVYLEDLFEKTYYSHAVHLRKPGAEIFQRVLDDNRLVAGETLFIDDTASNLEAPRQLGIRVHHLISGTSITDLNL